MSDEARWRCEKCGTLVYNALGVLKCRCTVWKAESVGQTMAADYKFGHAAGYRAGIEAAIQAAEGEIAEVKAYAQRYRFSAESVSAARASSAVTYLNKAVAAIRALLPATTGAKGEGS